MPPGHPAILVSCILFAACSNGSSAAATPPLRTSLVALPAVLQPGTSVELRPRFAGGTGRIDPEVGAVQSGGSYRVGPFANARRYTLSVTTPAGTETSTIDLPVSYRERIQTLDPSPIARTRHRAVDLPDGRILLVGGASQGPIFWSNSELYTPTTGQFAPAGELSTGRTDPALVVLPNGGVLAFGGDSNTASFEVATRVEEWDPTMLAWSVRGNTLCNRIRHTATRLPDGRVLLVGGAASGGNPSERAAEYWVPGFGARGLFGQPLHHRAAHTATLLVDGRVLLAGGYDPAHGGTITTTELFDPETETFQAAGELGEARFYHAAVRLPDGRVWVGGGESGANTMRTSIEVFDPSTRLWTHSSHLHTARTEVRALLLGSGEVLVVGGLVPGVVATDQVEFWNLATWRTRVATDRLPGPRTGHSLHLLPDGRVLAFGGDPGPGFPVPSTIVID